MVIIPLIRTSDDHDGEVRAALGYDFVPLCARMGEQDAKDGNACARTWLGRLAMPMPSENRAAAMADEGGRARKQERGMCWLGSAGGGERGREG